ncbi:MAG: hypothetical protein AB1445_13030 [Bacillota bacterium]
MWLNLAFANGVRAHLHVSWLWPEDERQTVVIGSKGALLYDEHEDELWLYDKGIKDDLTIWDAGKREIPVDRGGRPGDRGAPFPRLRAEKGGAVD